MLFLSNIFLPPPPLYFVKNTRKLLSMIKTYYILILKSTTGELDTFAFQKSVQKLFYIVIQKNRNEKKERKYYFFFSFFYYVFQKVISFYLCFIKLCLLIITIPSTVKFSFSLVSSSLSLLFLYSFLQAESESNCIFFLFAGKYKDYLISLKDAVKILKTLLHHYFKVT